MIGWNTTPDDSADVVGVKDKRLKGLCERNPVCHKRSEMVDGTTGGTPNDGRSQISGRLRLRMSDMSHIQRARARTLKMTIIIVFTFFCCWTPYVVIDLWYLFDPLSAEALDSRIQSSLFMFAVSNSCVNPLVYGSYTFNFATYIRKLFRCSANNTAVSRQASGVTRFTQIDRHHANGYVPALTDGKIYKLYPAEDQCLELMHATPLRRPLNRRKVVDTEETIALGYCEELESQSYHSHSSYSHGCSG
ncbi:uncharacterized protein LOC118186844 [Stegodyphus dumicola]|uniref:uncharacterized protein LOC118186844 n=1 Tax=Stegodyphus dumicola TaxID=202533 RepID=UPI0015B08758|nr:uncharacterized protein LOC118186844 [Stegodyphus dumicola]